MISIWFPYDFDMILICQSLWFSYGFGVSPFFWYDFDMIFLWFWSPSVFLIWFWYDFLMVLESLRFFDMIFLWFWSTSVFLIWFSYGFGVPPSFWYDFVIVFVRPHLPPPSPDPGHTSHPPLVGPQPHLPRPSPDPPPIPSPDSGTTEELSDFKLWFLSDSFGSPGTLQHATDLQSCLLSPQGCLEGNTSKLHQTS